MIPTCHPGRVTITSVAPGQAPTSFGEPVERPLPNSDLTARIAGAMFQWHPSVADDVLRPDRELTPALFDRYDHAGDAALRLAFDHAGVTNDGDPPDPRLTTVQPTYQRRYHAAGRELVPVGTSCRPATAGTHRRCSGRPGVAPWVSRWVVHLERRQRHGRVSAGPRGRDAAGHECISTGTRRFARSP